MPPNRISQWPLTPRERARENRLSLARAVTWLADQGIRQFTGIGSGLLSAFRPGQVMASRFPGGTPSPGPAAEGALWALTPVTFTGQS
jgi:hypothetical protein